MNKYFSCAFLMLMVSILSGCNPDEKRAYQHGLSEGIARSIALIERQDARITELESSQEYAAWVLGCSASWSCSLSQRIRNLPPLPAGAQIDEEMLQFYTKVFRMGDGLGFAVMILASVVIFFIFLKSKLAELFSNLKSTEANLVSLKEDYAAQLEDNKALKAAENHTMKELKRLQGIVNRREEAIAEHNKTKARLEAEVCALRKEKLNRNERYPSYNNEYVDRKAQGYAKTIFGPRSDD
ncbi:MAG: hypothetical protein U0998_06115 [Moraxellaceae bacterium]|nr:hypothetical protein [Moraxellaceae bacterium]MDZ4386778.1 hypothetical protein [Moraxellaceae bacterium]